jgi:RNA polymerase sigma-70 factor (ECF subfamily)
VSLEEAIKGAQSNDRSCQQYLYKKYAAQLYSICRRYTHPSSLDAQDILQDTFIQIFKSMRLFDPGRGAFESWVKTIAIRTSLKARQRNTPVYDFCEEFHDGPSMLNSGYENLVEEDLLSLVERLPSAYRDVFILFVVDDFSHQQIADLLQINISTSRSNLKRARDFLKSQLMKIDKISSL